MLCNGTHTLAMASDLSNHLWQEPETCAQELQELALALESEVAPAAALEVSRSLDTVRRSPDFSPSQRAAVITHVAGLGWALVMKARKEKGGVTASPNLKDAAATSGAPKVDTATSAVETRQRDEDARGAAKGGDAGGRQLAAKGRGVHHRQGDKLAGADAGKRVVSVVAGGGRRGPSAGADRPAAGNPLRPGARAGRSGGPAAWGPALALPNEVTLRVLHLTWSGQLWMARKRLLFLRCGGQVGRRGRRS